MLPSPKVYLNTTSNILFNGILPELWDANLLPKRNISMMGENDLIAGLGDLDHQAITQIHESYFPAMFRYARYRIGDDAVAEDIVSEAFTRLLEAAHAGRIPRRTLRGWLMGTVSNLVNDYFRKAYKQPITKLPENVSSEIGNPVSHSDKKNRQEQIRLALVKLTSGQQHVLALRFGSGCSLAETAEIMDKKPNAIKQLQFRALQALRQNIGGDFDGT